MNAKFIKLLFVTCFFLGTFAEAQSRGPRGFSVNGTVVQSGTPVTGSVNFRFQILDKTAACILYQEDHIGVTLTSTGAFSLNLGSGTSVQNNVDSSTTLGNNVFRNDVTVPTSAGCPGGLTSSAGDERLLRIIYNAGSGGVTMSPDVTIQGAPNAIVAETLQGLLPADLLKVNSSGSTVLTQSNLENIFSNTKYTRLDTLLSIAPTNYLQTGSNGSVSLPTVAGNPGSGLTAGQMWYDSAAGQLKYYDGSVKTISSGSAGTVTNSATLTSGKMWIGDATNKAQEVTFSGDATVSTAGALTIANNAVTSAKINSGAVTAAKLESGANGELFIGNGTGFTKSTLTAGTGISVTNASGAITIASPNAFLNGGNSFAGTATLGTNDNNALELETNGTTKMTILANGNVGIGTSSPSYNLDVNGSLNATSLYINGTQLTSGSSSSSVATGGGTVQIYRQTNTDAATGARSALELRNDGTGGTNEYLLRGLNAAGSMTSNISQDGKGYFASTMSVGTSTTTGILNLQNGAGNEIYFTGAAAANIFQSTASQNLSISTNGGILSLGGTAGASHLIVNGSGNIGVGTTSPGTGTKLAVEGQIKGKSFSTTAASIDFSNGNVATTTYDCAGNISFVNLRDGGSYTLIVTGTGTTQCNFSTSVTGDDAATVTYRFLPINAVRSASSHSIYSIIRAGDIVYVSWMTGF